VPLTPGGRSGITTAPFSEVNITDQVWLLMRTQLAVDFMIAPPLKARVAGGFNFPSAQYFGFELIYVPGAR
jgi:hypothetical protein